MLPEPVAVTLRVIGALDALQIPYLLRGSFASATYGVPRATIDADIVADLQLENVEALAGLLGNGFYFDLDTMRHAVRQRSSFNLVHLETMFKVDIFVFRGRASDHAEMANRKPHVLDPDAGQAIYTAGPEDTVLTKLDWYRMGGEVSERQWRDVLGILTTQGGRLGRSYLERWAPELNVDDLLKRALEEVAP